MDVAVEGNYLVLNREEILWETDSRFKSAGHRSNKSEGGIKPAGISLPPPFVMKSVQQTKVF